jgi:hypothetical protein
VRAAGCSHWPESFLAGVLALLLSGGATSACNVPVFRYALEKWNPDPYELIVLHRGQLAAADKALVEALHNVADATPRQANCTVETVDLDQQPEEDVQKVLAELPRAELPLLIVRYPAACRLTENVWAGQLSAAVVKNLVSSPARREIARRLGRGDSAVWVFLESGEPARDAAAATLLQVELARLARVLRLPELTDDPDDTINPGGPPLQIAFSLLRISREDPAEQMFVRMLRHSEPGLAGHSEPMVFPVYGRGRALYALVGAGITSDNITEAAERLVGPCTCKIKEQYPGVDLLVTARWDELLGGRRVTDETPPLTGLWRFAEPAPNPPRAAPQADSHEETPDPPSLLGLNTLLAVVTGLGVLAVATFLVLGKGRKRGGT